MAMNYIETAYIPERQATRQQELLLIGLGYNPSGILPDASNATFRQSTLMLLTPILFEPEATFRQDYFEFYTQTTQSVICKFSTSTTYPMNSEALQDDLILLGSRMGQTIKERDDFALPELTDDPPSYAVSRVADLMSFIYTGMNTHYKLASGNLARRENIKRKIFEVVFPPKNTWHIASEETSTKPVHIFPSRPEDSSHAAD